MVTILSVLYCSTTHYYSCLLFSSMKLNNQNEPNSEDGLRSLPANGSSKSHKKKKMAKNSWLFRKSDLKTKAAEWEVNQKNY